MDNKYKTIQVNGKQIREHVIVAEKKIGRKLSPNEVVHHIDGNKSNNSPENLQVMTRAEHALVHNSVQRLSKYWGGTKGRPFSEEHKKHMSAAKSGEKHPLYGKHLTQEHRAKLGRAVICVETGRRFDTVSDAMRFCGAKKNNSNIAYSIKNNRKAYGLHWKYAED